MKEDNILKRKLLAEGKIKVSDLSEFFDVSSETIRKDLLYLEEKGIAKKRLWWRCSCQFFD